TINPQPSTLNPQPSTLNPQPSTLNPQPSTLNPQPSTLNPQPGIRRRGHVRRSSADVSLHLGADPRAAAVRRLRVHPDAPHPSVLQGGHAHVSGLQPLRVAAPRPYLSTLRQPPG
ncbi:hypothetical protein T484DRAFT_1621922, partial [Baffinella frigidus]